MQLLLDLGWTNFHTCTTCSRYGPVQYWSNKAFPGYEIRVRTRKNTFTIVSKNMQIYGPAWVYTLESALKQFGIYEVVS
jgi:hypothetical protein